jgi:SAM-dependent methyltransferase
MSDTNPLLNPTFPRSNTYDPTWVMSAQMGPNPLWLAEWLVGALPLRPGQRVLDLGCGTALSSIFLAREFGVHVCAADLWVDPDENWQRAQEVGVADLVCPMKAEAHALPFAKGYFDAIISIDSYQYFGTDLHYLFYLARFLRPGGMLGIVMPGLMQEMNGKVPEHLSMPQANGACFWEEECLSFLTVDAWTALWKGNSQVDIRCADTLPDGWRHWRDFERAVEAAGKNIFPSVAESLDRDAGRFLGFVRLVAERTPKASGMNLYHPALKAVVMGAGAA